MPFQLAKGLVLLVADASDGELETCQRLELTKGEMQSIAGIKDQAERAQLFDRLDEMDFDDAWDDVDPDAKRVTGKSRRQEAAEAAAKAEQQPELSDGEWFNKNCREAAQRLAVSISFQFDALLYREIAEARRLFRLTQDDSPLSQHG